MAEDLYVDGAEITQRAAQMQRLSRRLASYAANLSALMQRVYESGAISSDPTKDSLDAVATQLREVSNELSTVVEGIDGMASGFLSEIDRIDSYE